MQVELDKNEIKYLKLVIGQELFWENLAVANGVCLKTLYSKLGGSMKKVISSAMNGKVGKKKGRC